MTSQDPPPVTPSDAPPALRRTGDALTALSARVLAVEKALVTTFSALLLALVLLNVATRLARAPLYWIDEAAVFSVVWLTFVGASCMSRLKMDFTVTLLEERLGPVGRRRLKVLAGLATLGFGVALLAVCWRWLDPLGIAHHGFDARAYAADSFNFLYTERSQTLEWPLWVVQSVIPLFAATYTLHAAAHLAEVLGWASPPADAPETPADTGTHAMSA